MLIIFLELLAAQGCGAGMIANISIQHSKGLSLQMMTAWTNFAKTGYINGSLNQGVNKPLPVRMTSS